MHPIPIIKFGTASATDSSGNLAEEIIGGVASQVALLIQKFRAVLASSGAVENSSQFLQLKETYETL